MGRRINIPHPLVIHTELSALTTSFQVIPSDTLEQWYYVNDNSFMPDRTITPLTLVPRMRAYDPDTQRIYDVSFSTVQWFATIGNNNEYRILETTDGDVDFYLDGFNLVVKRNVAPPDTQGGNNAVMIRCHAIYIDPREVGTTAEIDETILLRSNRDATEVFPIVTISTPKQMVWNPFGAWTDANARFVLTAKVMYQGADVTSENEIRWYGTETENGVTTAAVPIDEMPAYVSGQGTATLTVDARFAEHLTVIARARKDEYSPLYASCDYRTIAWKIPHMSATTYSEQGTAVRSSTGMMKFGTIVNIPGSILDDEVKNTSLACQWKRRLPTESTETLIGWGATASQEGASLMQPNGRSVLVYPYIYLMGAYKEVTFSGDTVTDGDGTTIVERGNDSN